MPFLLQRIYIGVGAAVKLYAIGLYLGLLTFTLRLHQCTDDTNTSTGRYRFHLRFRKFGEVHHDLYIFNGRTVIHGNKIHIFIATARTHPTLYIYFCPVKRCIKCIDDFGSFHCFHTFLYNCTLF